FPRLPPQRNNVIGESPSINTAKRHSQYCQQHYFETGSSPLPRPDSEIAAKSRRPGTKSTKQLKETRRTWRSTNQPPQQTDPTLRVFTNPPAEPHPSDQIRRTLQPRCAEVQRSRMLSSELGSLSADLVDLAESPVDWQAHFYRLHI